MEFGLKVPRDGTWQRPTQLFSSCLRFGLFIPFCTFNLPSSEEIQGDLTCVCLLLLRAYCQGGLSIHLAPR